MNESLEKLIDISKKDSKKIIGLMSGTSLDGLDIALCEVTGNGLNTSIALLKFETISYSNDFKDEIRSVFSKQNIELEKLCLLNEWIGSTHAEMINQSLRNWNISNDEIDLIASHGQTIYHAPKSLHQNNKFGNGTLQIGDGDHIAVNTGIITISDFRQKHIAAGGEGAPLAAYGDYLLFSSKEKNRILLNIGGISNITFIPADAAFEKVICTDVGPGNTLMDAWVSRNYTGIHYDKDALIAKQGKPNYTLLNTLQTHPFYKIDLPKSTGPELFNLAYVEEALIKSNTKDISNEDILATLNILTTNTIFDVIENLISGMPNSELYISGGGIHNPLLMEYIRNQFDGILVSTTDALNINPDAKEAILFALLANELISGNNNFGKGSKTMPAVGMGKICLPC